MACWILTPVKLIEFVFFYDIYGDFCIQFGLIDLKNFQKNGKRAEFWMLRSDWHTLKTGNNLRLVRKVMGELFLTKSFSYVPYMNGPRTNVISNRTVFASIWIFSLRWWKGINIMAFMKKNIEIITSKLLTIILTSPEAPS